jgi:hypothetical protein
MTYKDLETLTQIELLGLRQRVLDFDGESFEAEFGRTKGTFLRWIYLLLDYQNNLQKGDKVTVKSIPHKNEKGIVKSIGHNGTIFVVCHCAEDWENFENYTAAATPLILITKGWV